jgi:hypothetical protein
MSPAAVQQGEAIPPVKRTGMGLIALLPASSIATP